MVRAMNIKEDTKMAVKNYEVEIIDEISIHVTTNTVDGIGCALATYFTTDYGITSLPSTKVGGHAYTVWFYNENKAVSEIENILKEFLKLVNHESLDTVDPEILKKYTDIDNRGDERWLISLPGIIYVSGIALTDELAYLIDNYIVINTNLGSNLDFNICIEWFDYHDNTKKYICDDKYGLCWFHHTTSYSDKISTAELMVRYLKENNCNETEEDDTCYMPNSNGKYVYDTLIPEISRYVTGVWKDEPEKSDGNEWQVQAILNAYDFDVYVTFGVIVATIIYDPDFQNSLDTDRFTAIFNMHNSKIRTAISNIDNQYRIFEFTDFSDIFDIECIDKSYMYNTAMFIADSTYDGTIIDAWFDNHPDIDIAIALYPSIMAVSFVYRDYTHFKEIVKKYDGTDHKISINKEELLNMMDMYCSSIPKNSDS